MRFEFLLYDVTSTYFEGEAEGDPQARRGYSRDQRPGNKRGGIGLVCTPEGLPLIFEVFAGNRADVGTVEEIVRGMEEKYGQAERIWVMDRGMVSEANISFSRERKARYLVGTPKRWLRSHERTLVGTTQLENGAGRTGGAAGRAARRRSWRAICIMSRRRPGGKGTRDAGAPERTLDYP